MYSQVYVDPVVNNIALFSQVTISLLAYIFNFILIYIARTCSRREIGPYRILITYFAISDLYYNTMHFIVYPIPEMYGNAYLMSGRGMFSESFGLGMYLGVYGHVFPILIFHFVYRLLAMKYPHLLAHFPLFFICLMAATLASNLLWFSVYFYLFRPDEESILALTPLLNGSIPLPVIHTMETAQKHTHAFFWTVKTFEGPRYRNILGAGLLFSSMISTYSIILFCCFHINKSIRGHTKSTVSISLHKQLFRSLIYQAFIPLFTAYYPAGTCLLFPLIGLSFVNISILCPYACATHPLVDPLLLIFTINSYRRTFLNLVGFPKFDGKPRSISDNSTRVFKKVTKLPRIGII